MGDDARQRTGRPTCQSNGIRGARNASPDGSASHGHGERSQHRNRKLALARLKKKLNEINSKRHGDAREERWRAHQELERGNPVRAFRKEDE